MKFTFDIKDKSCLSIITDNASFLDGIFKCLGNSVVSFKDTIVEDNLEVIFRIAESLRILDLLIEKGNESNEIIYFTFQFENRFYFNCNYGNITAFDREQNSIEVDNFSLDYVAQQRNKVISFINESLRNISPYLAIRLINREVI